MKRISVFQVLTVLAILVLAVAPVFARTHLKYNADNPTSYTGPVNANDAIATEFTNTDANDILGMRFNLQAGNYDAFSVLIYDKAASGTPGTLKKEIAVPAGAATSFIDYQRVTGADVGSDPFFVILKWLSTSPNPPMVGMDPATAGHTQMLDYETGTYSTISGSDAMVEVVAGRLADLSGDGDIDTPDALYALECFAGIKTRTPEDVLVGDTNLDETLDTVDALAFLNIFAGINTIDDYFK